MATGLEGFCHLLPWFRVDRQEGELLPVNWFCWGYVKSLSNDPRHLCIYISIRLPSYQFKKEPWEFSPSWRQLSLHYFSLVTGEGNWRVIEANC